MNKLDSKEINNQIFKEIVDTLMETEEDINKLVENQKANALSETDLTNIVEKLILENPESVEDYKQGKDRAIKYLMGQIMKETRGKADPALANQLLLQKLSEQ